MVATSISTDIPLPSSFPHFCIDSDPVRERTNSYYLSINMGFNFESTNLDRRWYILVFCSMSMMVSSYHRVSLSLTHTHQCIQRHMQVTISKGPRHHWKRDWTAFRNVKDEKICWRINSLRASLSWEVKALDSGMTGWGSWALWPQVSKPLHVSPLILMMTTTICN